MATNTLAVTPTAFEVEQILNNEDFRDAAGGLFTNGRTGNRWVFTLTYQNRTGAERRALWAELIGAKGKQNRLRLPMSLLDYTRTGTGGGSPVVDGATNAGVTSIDINSGAISTTGWLAAGDWISIGAELKLVLADVDTDASGDGTISFWPELHANVADQDSVNIETPFGDFFVSELSGLGGAPFPNDWLNQSVTLVLEEDVRAAVSPVSGEVSAVIALLDEFGEAAGYGPSDDPDGLLYGRTDLAQGDTIRVTGVSVAGVTVTLNPGGGYDLDIASGVASGTYNFTWALTAANPTGPTTGTENFDVS